MDDMPTGQRQHLCIRPPLDHLRNVFRTCDSALRSTNDERGATCADPFIPITTLETSLRKDYLPRLKRERPARRSFSERVSQIRYKALTNLILEFLARAKRSSPAQHRRQVARDIHS